MGNRAEEIYELIMAENFPKIIRYTKPHIRKTKRTKLGYKQKKSTPRCIAFNGRKSKAEKILKEAITKYHLIYWGTRIRITAGFSSENMKARKHGIKYLKHWEKKKKHQPRNLYQVKLSFKGKEK